MKENGEVTGGVMVFSDLSRVKGLEEKVRKLEEEALWRKLTEGIAHEVRNPLVSVRTFAQLFPDRYQDKEFRKDFYRIVNADISRLDELINKLERYAEPLSLELQTEDLNSIVDEVLSGFKIKLAEEKITVKKNYSPAIPRIVTDGDKLAEAFSYIVENGIQAMPGGGTLTISTKIEKNADREIAVKFSNTGRAIPRKDIGRLFSPLFGGHLKGLGLGLPIAQKIVEAHEGRIEVDSGLGKGTSFKVFLRVSLDVEELKRKGITAKLYPGMK
jgi:two-component system sensor histidine kinase HydH